MSASTLERLDACPPSAVLPQVVDAGEDAERGSELHVFVRSVIAGVPRERALAAISNDEWRATAENIDFNNLVGDLRDVRAEVAYALDTMNGKVREVGVNIGRNYGLLGPWEEPGTNDYEGTIVVSNTPAVRDLKSGQPVTACRDNPQLKFHARARRLRLLQQGMAVPRVAARIDYLRASGRVDHDAHTFGAFELDDFGDQLHDIKKRVAAARIQVRNGEIPTVYPGDQCRYCGALQACPAYVALVHAAANATHIGSVPIDGAMTVDSIAPDIAALSAEDKARAWELANRGITAFETIKEALKMIARRDPIKLANGQTVALGKEFPVEHFSQSAALELLRAKGASEDELRALYKSTTQAQVRARGKKFPVRHLKVVA